MTFKADYNKKYALAVSGGVDSMCLLHMFACLSPRPNFCVVTVNHGIRDNAADDCRFVEDYCRKLGVPCQTFAVDVPSYAKQHKLSEETAARVLRYKVLDDLPVDYVCLAHHMTDQAETVLMHVLRGSGVSGAAGMRAESGRYLRPLLDMTRYDIEMYAEQHNVPFVVDSTNECIDYTRNYIRMVVMPSIEKVFPQAERTIARFAESAAADNDFLDGLADTTDVVLTDNGAKIPLRLLEQAAPVATRVLRKVFAALGVYADVEKRHINALLALSRSCGGKRLDVGNGFVAYNDYDYLTLVCTEKAHSTPVSVPPECANGDKMCFCVPFAVGTTDTPSGKVVVSLVPQEGALKVDLDKIPDGATIRFVIGGEVFTKFGGGTKPLRRYLIDKKIPQRFRADIPLITCGSEVLVVCGVEISDKVRVGDNSQVAYVKFFREEE